MKNNRIKAVVVGGWFNDKGDMEMITLIGAFENVAEAYGEAYLYLDELSQHYLDDEGAHITLLFELEGETGYGMNLCTKDGKIHDYAYILMNDNYEDSNKNKEEQNAGNT